MKDREELVAAFLDGEAAPEESAALLEGLRRDPALARHVAGLLVTERLLRLQRPDGDAFAREVLERLRAAPRPAFGPSVLRRLASHPKGRLAVSVAAALVIVAMGALMLWPERPSELSPNAVIEEIRGMVRVQRPADLVQGKPGVVVEPSHRIYTERGSHARLRYAEGSTLSLGPDTSVSGYVRVVTVGAVERRGVFLRIERGALEADVQPQAKERPFVFQTAHTEVLVLGTRLKLEVTSRSTRVEVESGRVWLTALKGSPVEVVGGKYAVAGPGIVPVIGSLGPEPGPIALYRFRESSGGLVKDVSGLQPALDFTIKDETGRPLWEPWKVGPGTAVAFVYLPDRLVEAVRKSRAITIEMRLRHEGAPRISHVVRTFEASGAVRYYWDGVAKDVRRLSLDLGSWNGDFRGLLTDDVARKWPWPGEYDVLAIYDRALPAEEVRRNFESGNPK